MIHQVGIRCVYTFGTVVFKPGTVQSSLVFPMSQPNVGYFFGEYFLIVSEDRRSKIQISYQHYELVSYYGVKKDTQIWNVLVTFCILPIDAVLQDQK